MTGDLSEEITQLAERFRNAPESRLFAPLADAYRKSGLVDKAVQLCEEGIKRFPDYASAHVILGKCYYDKGATERSKAEFTRVLEIDPENMVALKYLGDILLGESMQEQASEFYNRLLAIDPTNEEVSRIMEEMKSEFIVRKIDLEESDRVKQVHEPSELATMTLAGIYASQGYYTKALRMYRDIVGKEPGNEEAARMIDKIGSLIDSSEEEREEAFDDKVLTISVDDVSQEIMESTSGHGGRSGEDEMDGRGSETESFEESLEKEYESLAEGGEDDITGERPSAEESTETISAEEGSADAEPVDTDSGRSDGEEEYEAGKKTGEDEEDEDIPDGMNDFQKWLRQMKDKNEGS